MTTPWDAAQVVLRGEFNNKILYLKKKMISTK